MIESAKGRAYTYARDGRDVVFYSAAGEIKVLVDFPGSAPVATDSVVYALTDGLLAFAGDGDAVHVGRGPAPATKPLWVGAILKGQFGGAAPSASETDYQVEEARIKIEVTAQGNDVFATFSQVDAANVDETVFGFNTHWRYYASFVYDDRQESPLIHIGTHSVSGTHGAKSISITPKVATDTLSPRVTALGIYRAELVGGKLQEAARLVGYVRLDEGTWTDTAGSTRPRKEQAAALTEDSTTTRGPTFEENTGIPETLEHMDLQYGMSVVCGAYHVVGNVNVSASDDGGEHRTFLFRSLPYLFDSFVWSRDALALGGVPTAAAFFMGRAFVFARAHTWIVDVELMRVEEEWEGIGCLGPDALAATDRGLFWADQHTIYHFDGAKVERIGDALASVEDFQLRHGERAYRLLDTAANVVVGYDAESDLVVVLWNDATEDERTGQVGGYGAGFRVMARRWTLFETAYTEYSGRLQAHDGRLWVANSDGELAQFPPGEGDARWEWISHEIALGARGTTFYKVRVLGDKPILQYSEDDEAWRAAELSQIDGGWEGVINSHPAPPWRKVRHLKLRLRGRPDVEVRAVALVYRAHGAR